MSDKAKKRGEIHYPKSQGHVNGRHFAAYGRVDKGTWLSGQLIDGQGKEIAEGRLAYFAPSKLDRNRMFWILCFQTPAAHVPNKPCTLRLIDKMDNSVLAECPNISAGAEEVDVSITDPTKNTTNLPQEFVATGTADASGGDVSGTMSNCDTPPSEVDEIDPPPDWTLYCYIVNPVPPCTLTVTQGTMSKDSVGGLAFGTS